MYSNNQVQIRAGLVNYIGALLASSQLEDDRAKKHNVAAILLEESATLCKDNDNNFDMFACKPILRLTVNILTERVSLLKKLPDEIDVSVQIKSYEYAINTLNNLIENTKL